MAAFIVRRLIQAIPTFLLAMLIVFFAIRLVPGDQLTTLIGEQVVGKADRAALKHQLNLDKPWPQQYVEFVGGMFKGDLGQGTFDHQAVTAKLKKRLPITLELTLLSAVVAILIGVPLGVLSAIKQNTVIDYVARIFGLLALSIPSFVLGTVVLIALALWFGWVPTLANKSFFSDPGANLQQYFLPALILGMALAGSIMRFTRSMMLEVLREDFIRTARAKGLSGRTVVSRHGLRNALIPVITVIGLQVATLMGGTVIIESIFGLGGIGSLFIDALNRRDYPVIEGVNVVLVTAVVVVNIAVDMSYAFLDPRLRHG